MVNLIVKVKSGMIVVIVLMDEGKTIFKGEEDDKRRLFANEETGSGLVYR